jgi:DNA gyrase inhibitor GyrI
MELKYKSFGPQRYVAMRHIGPYPTIGSTFEKLGAWGKAAGLSPSDWAAFYYDDPTSVPPEQQRSDACIPVAADYTNDDPAVSILDIPQIKVAYIVHKGHYSKLGETWGQMMSLAQEKEVGLNWQYNFELYINDCNSLPEDEWLTEVCVSVN